MTVSVREAGDFERLVGFELTDAEIDAAKSAAARRLAKDLKLKGFRPGKAPRPVVEAAVGADRLRSEAIEDAIPSRLTEVLKSESLNPAVNPSLETVEDISGGVNVEVRVTLWPSLSTPPDYRDRRIEVDSPEVSEDEIDSQLLRMREQFGQVEEVERPAAEGDFVSLDVSATIDGDPLDDALATELLYRVGSAGLLEGADEALVGLGSGESVTIEAPVPEGMDDEQAESASFTIVVNEVKELIVPDLTDEWVDENTEMETVDELRRTMRTRIEDAKRGVMARRFMDLALSTLITEAEIDLPEALVQAEMEGLLHSFIHRLEGQDVTLADYFAASGLTQQQLLADLQRQADRSIRTRLVLEAVIDEASLEVTDSEMDEVLQAASARSSDPAAFLGAIRGTPQELALRSDMLRDKALKLVLENATPVDPDGNVLDLDTQGDDNMDIDPNVSADIVGEVVEGEVVEAEIVEGEIVDDITYEREEN